MRFYYTIQPGLEYINQINKAGLLIGVTAALIDGGYWMIGGVGKN